MARTIRPPKQPRALVFTLGFAAMWSAPIVLGCAPATTPSGSSITTSPSSEAPRGPRPTETRAPSAVEPEPAPQADLHGFVALSEGSGPLDALDPLGELGGVVVRQSCTRMTETQIEPAGVARAWADARARHPPADGLSFCLDWVAGPSVDDYWVAYQSPVKHGIERYRVINHIVAGRAVSTITLQRPHTHALHLADGRVVALVLSRAGAFSESWWAADAGAIERAPHYATSVFRSDPTGARVVLPSLVVTTAPCKDKATGSRLVDPIAIEQVQGSVYVLGRDCTRDDAMVVERWSPGSLRSEIHPVPARLSRGSGFHLAPGQGGWWIAADELGPDDNAEPIATFVGRIGNGGWSRVRLSGIAQIESMAVDPTGALWLTRDRALFRAGAAGEAERIPSPPATDVEIVKSADGVKLRIGSTDGRFERPIPR